MGELDGFVIFDGAAERKKRELPDIVDDPQKIGTVKGLRKYLCSDAVPRGHNGPPRVSKCRNCISQCAYGKRLIELMEERKKTENPENKKCDTASSGMRTIQLTESQCQNVADFIEHHLLDVIRNDTDIDNVEWVSEMISAMHTLRKEKS